MGEKDEKKAFASSVTAYQVPGNVLIAQATHKTISGTAVTIWSHTWLNF